MNRRVIVVPTTSGPLAFDVWAENPIVAMKVILAHLAGRKVAK